MNKKGYNGAWVLFALIFGIIIGVAIIWYTLSQGWLPSSLLPTTTIP